MINLKQLYKKTANQSQVGIEQTSGWEEKTIFFDKE